MINEHIDIEFYKTQYQELGTVSIENWLNDEYANMLYDHLYTIPADWWFHSSVNSNGMINIRNFHYNELTMKENERIARQKLFNGEFSYIFWRNHGHGETCECKECEFKNGLLSEDCLIFLYQLTGLRVDTISEMFSSWYRSGCFLSSHSDTVNGQLGFSYNLTKDWKAEYGGNLHILSADNFTIEKVSIPSFNTLNLFGLSNQKVHFVSEVVEGVPSNRYAISGWYK